MRYAASMKASLASRLFRPVPASSLAAFRIAFGLILVWEVQRYLRNGWVERYWVEPEVSFPYEWFTWVTPLPEGWLYLVVGVWGVGALALTLGLGTRWAAAAVFVSFGYLFLLDAARYLNHFYLVLLLAFLLMVVPSDRVGSWSRARRAQLRPEGEGAPTVPAWALHLVRFQIAVPYVFGGIAKLNGDWLRGEPIRTWLAARDHIPWVGRFFQDEAVVAGFAYGGLGLDLAAPFALAWRPTRGVAFGALLAFHLLNARLFSIGIFPFLMIFASLTFFEPDWPARAWRRALRAPAFHVAAFVAGTTLAVAADPTWELVPMTVTGVGVAVWLGSMWVRDPAVRRAEAVAAPSRPSPPGTPAASPRRRAARTAVLAFLTVWVGIQVLVPLRVYVLPGDAAWNEAGHRFAWRMKLRSKRGDVAFEVTPPDGAWQVRGSFDDQLADWQRSWVATRPYLTLAFAHHLADRFEAMGAPDVRVRAIGSVSLNGRPAHPLVDPEVDLASLPRRAPSYGPWVTTLDEPLPVPR